MKYFLYEALLNKKIKEQISVYTTVPVSKVNNYPQVLVYLYAYTFTYGYLGIEESAEGQSPGSKHELPRLMEGE